MIPSSQMRELYDTVKSAGSSSVVLTEFSEGTHMEAYDLCRAQYWPAVTAFVLNLFSSDGVQEQILLV